MSSEKPRISILIPAFNKEKHIERALRSVAEQTLRDLEIIVIDDASTDSTAELVRKFAGKDKRVRLIRHEQNRGTLSARITGFREAGGDYVMCLDADDTLDPDCAEKTFALAKKYDCEIVGFGARLLRAGKTSGTIDAVRGRLSAPHVFEAAFCDHSYNWSVCLKLFRRDLFEKALADTEDFYCVSAEDFYFYTILSFYAQKIVFPGKIFYNYYIEEGLTGHQNTPESFRRMATMLDALKAVSRFLKKQNESKYDIAFKQREQEHLQLLFSRFPSTDGAGSMQFLLEQYPEAVIMENMQLYFGTDFTEKAFLAVRNNESFPQLPEQNGSEQLSFRKKVIAALLPPESPQWFLSKRIHDLLKWRKYK